MLPKNAESVFGSGTAGGIWKSMLAEKLADQISRSGGIGIAQRTCRPSGFFGAAGCAGRRCRRGPVHGSTPPDPHLSQWRPIVMRPQSFQAEDRTAPQAAASLADLVQARKPRPASVKAAEDESGVAASLIRTIERLEETLEQETAGLRCTRADRSQGFQQPQVATACSS